MALLERRLTDTMALLERRLTDTTKAEDKNVTEIAVLRQEVAAYRDAATETPALSQESSRCVAGAPAILYKSARAPAPCVAHR